MSIQISVTLWTVICFVTLMLLLDRLLFRPLLRLMDERREKIDAARRTREELSRAREEALRAREEETAAARKRAAADAARALEEARQETVRAAARRQEEIRRRLEDERAALDGETLRLLESMESRTEPLVLTIAGCIQAWASEGKTSFSDEP